MATNTEDDAVADRAARWAKMRKTHYSDAPAFSASSFQKEKMPPELLRKIVRDHGDLSHRKFKDERKGYVGALKYLPHAMMKVLENMPMPWESCRQVSVLYHVTGALTLIRDTPTTSKPVFHAQWGTAWLCMRREKRDRPNFRRAQIPSADDEEPFIDYADHLLDIPLQESIRLEMDPEEDASVLPWLYDNELAPFALSTGRKQGRTRTQTFGSEELNTLLRLAAPLTETPFERRGSFLFDRRAFAAAKKIGVNIPGGPVFSVGIGRRADDLDDDATDFNAEDRVLVRHSAMPTDMVAFPHLYSRCNDRGQAVQMHAPLGSVLPSRPASIASLAFFDSELHLLPVSLSCTSDLETPAAPVGFSFPPLLSNWKTLDEEAAPLGLEGALTSLSATFGIRRVSPVRMTDVSLVDRWLWSHWPLAAPEKVRQSHRRLLKWAVTNATHRTAEHPRKRVSLAAAFLQTKFFQLTSLDWLEASLQVLRQGHIMLKLLIQRKSARYLHLDYNFNLKPTRTLTTKERKKSRFGNAFHLCREILRFLKLLVDLHVQFRLGEIDAFQLADGLQYLFCHVGELTGMYRYKYKLMKQIKLCKDLKHLVYARFNVAPVGKGPGVGFWQPMWRVWISFMRGAVPLLEKWLGNLLARQFQGRSPDVTRSVTKQRIESHFDVELRASVVHEVLSLMPAGARQSKAKVILNHLSESWRCYKANIPWKVPGLPGPIEEVIARYIKLKADWWIGMTHRQRADLRRGRIVDKTLAKKNAGRLTRLWLMAEQERQSLHLCRPSLRLDDAVGTFSVLAEWLRRRNFPVIPFPPVAYKHDMKILTLALESLRESFSVKSRLNAAQRELLALVERAFDNPHETLARIKRSLLQASSFKEVEVEFMDNVSAMHPVYQVDSLERITDAYLDQYLWFEADRRSLFPNWVKPADAEIAPLMARRLCEGINNLDGVWDTANGQSVVLVQTRLSGLAENMNLTLLNRLLRQVVDPSLADYLSAKNNVSLSFKDMSHVNSVGVLRGLQFSGFLLQLAGLAVDLGVIGVDRALDLAGPPQTAHPLMRFDSAETQARHPVVGYFRNLDEAVLVLRLDMESEVDLVQSFVRSGSDLDQSVSAGQWEDKRRPDDEGIERTEDIFPTKRCWPRSQRMKLTRHDVLVGRAALAFVRARLPSGLVHALPQDTFVSVYSRENPFLLFSTGGFEVRMWPRVRMPGMQVVPTDGCWMLRHCRTRELSAVAYLRVNQQAIDLFESRVRALLMASGSTAFTKIASRWNSLLIGFVGLFREAILGTPELSQLFARCETRVQNRVKIGLNSKMPTRFPPVVFYAPKELGGLGMLSMGQVMVPLEDLRPSSETAGGGRQAASQFKKAMRDEANQARLIPILYRYLVPWESEFADSERVWTEYEAKKQDALLDNRRVALEEMDEYWDRGLPRINTLFQKDRLILPFDRGWRLRLQSRKYQVAKYDPFWWTHPRHDGKLWSLNEYRTDVIQALGGVECILEHSLFRATFFQNWEGLFWEKASGFEESMKYKKLTNAQRSGLSQIPNRRFTLWWSPTINRADVYIGFQVQLDLTGILMHGKIPTLKVSLVQIFRAHLWQKIHESMVVSLCHVFEEKKLLLALDAVQQERIHPRKSYRLSSSCADIVLVSMHGLPLSKPSLLQDSDADVRGGGASAVGRAAETDRLWVDVQLRWGDYDSHDIERYARSKFMDYTSDSASIYPSDYGIVIAVDLAYNSFSAFGYWSPELKTVVTEAMNKIMKGNPALYVLRERVRKALQLYSAEPAEAHLNSQNLLDLFGSQVSWFVDDTNVYRVSVHKTLEGNLTTKAVNGAIFIFDPRSGACYLKIIHSSVWAGQRRLAQLAKWKTAEEVSALVRSLPVEDQPRQLILMRRGLRDPLEVNLMDYTNIILKGSDLRIPFQSCFRLPTVGDLVAEATEPKLVIFRLYDDWLDTVSANTAFSRLVLILRGLHVDHEKAWCAIADPELSSVSSEGVSGMTFFWPKHSPAEWATIEGRLKDLIVDDYAAKHEIRASALTQTEIRDVILGMSIAPPSVQRQQMAAIESQARAAVSADQAVTTRHLDERGEEVIVTTTTAFEQQQFQGRADWRSNALEAARPFSLPMVADLQPAATSSSATAMVSVAIPRDLVTEFRCICDSVARVGGYLFGRSRQTEDEESGRPISTVLEVRCIAVVPQIGSASELQLATLPERVLSLEMLAGMECLGFVHSRRADSVHDVAAMTTGHGEAAGRASPLDLANVRMFSSLLAANPLISLSRSCCLQLDMRGAETICSSYRLTSRGLDWATSLSETERAKAVSVGDSMVALPDLVQPTHCVFADLYAGFFMSPVSGSGAWNYAFNGLLFKAASSAYALGPARPLEFHHPLHRQQHFRSFCGPDTALDAGHADGLT